jgi:hypothetical protein
MNNPQSTDLHAADTPEATARILRNAAQLYRESVPELQAAHQDPTAGKVWNKVAAILERAAGQVDKLKY